MVVPTDSPDGRECHRTRRLNLGSVVLLTAGAVLAELDSRSSVGAVLAELDSRSSVGAILAEPDGRSSVAATDPVWTLLAASLGFLTWLNKFGLTGAEEQWDSAAKTPGFVRFSIKLVLG